MTDRRFSGRHLALLQKSFERRIFPICYKPHKTPFLVKFLHFSPTGRSRIRCIVILQLENKMFTIHTHYRSSFQSSTSLASSPIPEPKPHPQPPHPPYPGPSPSKLRLNVRA